MSEGELPREVAEVTQKEFGQQPEVARRKWNKRFNDLADKLLGMTEYNTRSEVDFRKQLTPKDDENVAVTAGKGFAKGASEAATVITNIELGLLKSLAELGAKATGGRTSGAETRKSK